MTCGIGTALGGGAARGSACVAGVRRVAADGSSTCAEPVDGAEEADGDAPLRTSSTSACMSPICLAKLWSSCETCVLNAVCASARLSARTFSWSNLDSSVSISAVRFAVCSPMAVRSWRV